MGNSDNLQFDEEKFRQLILYIAKKSTEDEFFGAVKLNKILYFSDFQAYRALGKSISGAEYQHLDQGPAPRQLPWVRDSMFENKELDIVYESKGEHFQHRHIAIAEPNMSSFSPDELQIVDQVIDEYWGLTGSMVSKISHQEFGWQMTINGETIPYRMAWLSLTPLSKKHLGHGNELLERLKNDAMGTAT